MNSLITVGLVFLVLGLSVLGLWDRFRCDDGVQEWMLNVPGLDGLCQEYLDYIRQMSSGQHELEVLQYLDSQRQVAHDQILQALGLDRSNPLDVELFAQRYLGWR
jgi:hypothetical protein